jgi:hypothetical protein
MPKPEKKKRITIIYVLDGEVRSGECVIPVDEPNPMAQVINDLGLIAEGYRVQVTPKS